ncbi:MAG: hypothetical protein AAF392_02880 [Bacteroidota bacterium]
MNWHASPLQKTYLTGDKFCRDINPLQDEAIIPQASYVYDTLPLGISFCIVGINFFFEQFLITCT